MYCVCSTASERNVDEKFIAEVMRIHNAVIAGEVSVETLKSELDYGMDIQIETDWTDVLEDSESEGITMNLIKWIKRKSILKKRIIFFRKKVEKRIRKIL